MCRIVSLLIRILPVAAYLSFLLSSTVRADDISLSSRLTYTSSDSKTTIKSTGETIRSDFYRFDQFYNFNISKTIYPYLTFRTGTIFQWDNFTTKTEGTKIDSEERLLRPFVGLRLNNPLHSAGIEYRRTEIYEETTDIPNSETFRDELDAVFEWNPVELPRLEMRYLYTQTDDDPKTIDETDELLTIFTEYTAWQELLFKYLYTRSELKDRIANFETLEQTHLGKVEYAHQFFDRRLFLNTNYRIRYNTLEFPGAETVDFPLLRFEGLFFLDNSPQDGPALEVNNALIDGNLTASAGIDIGLNGDQTTLANIGLDLGSAANVDELRIWVDRRLTTTVADSFSWDVYTSPDNTNNSTWTLVATVSPADFGTVDNRFEIAFPTVNTRYIKVVTAALSPAVPDAVNFPNIFVTEMQAFVILSGQEVTRKNTTLDQNFDLSLNAKVSNKTTLGYTFQVTSLDQDLPDRQRLQVSNNLNANHIFNHIFSARARLLRIDEKLEDDDDDDTQVQHTYSLAFIGSYLPTLNQTLTFSGDNSKEDEGSTYDYSVLLRTNATLYRGWSAFADLGYARSLLLDDTRNTSKIMRLGTNIVPNDKITFNINYALRETDESNGEDRNISESELDFEVFFNPFRTLSITARVNYVDRENFNTTLQQYFVNWSPFPDGTLQLFFTYNELLSSGEDREDRTIGPGLNWTISRHFSLDMTYNIVESKTSTLKTDNNNFFAELKIRF